MALAGLPQQGHTSLRCSCSKGIQRLDRPAERALANREARTWPATTMDEVKELAKANTGYIKTMWCGDLACEMKMKEEAGLSSRCMPFEQEQLSDVCPCCGKPAKAMVYWGVAY